MKFLKEIATSDSRHKDIVAQNNEEADFIVEFLREMDIHYSPTEIKSIMAKNKKHIRDMMRCLYNVSLPYIGMFRVSPYKLAKIPIASIERANEKRKLLRIRINKRNKKQSHLK